ncbi:MFS transporter [Nonomuraea glycinis]|uniref:MFS transporter n=1 Tax=Nonomuraea glycinis TaxID=2047744 RepID=A0A918AI74_9ACTN|nr:MFS transporter [Nonomuraea glycinis]
MVRDWRGRSYLIGPVPRDRTRMLWLALAAMAAISPLQYGFAALLAGDAPGLFLLAACLLCQAAGALPAIQLVRRGRLSVRATLTIGAALSTIGLLTIALTGGPTAAAASAWPGGSIGTGPALLLGYAVLGGLGAGIVYGVCSEVVSSWYPERPAAQVSLVTGAFGYGAVPMLVWAGPAPGATPTAFLVAAVFAVAAIGAAARALRLAPHRWWPDTVEPRSHALDAAILRRNPVAVKQFGLAQALRTRALPALAVILACAGAVSLFDVIAVAATGSWAALAVMVALNGAGRSLAVRCSELFGRRRVLATVLTVLAAGQVLLLAALQAGQPLLWPGVIAAGLGGGAFYPLVASLVREFFGVERVGEIHAVVHSAKAVAGVAAVALALLSLTAPATALLVAAALAALPALATLRLRAPGLPATIPV